MDHSYRAVLHGNGQGSNRRRHAGMGTQYLQPDPEPLPACHDALPPRIFAFVSDLFFVAKIQEIARKLNVKVEFVKTADEIFEKQQQNGNGEEKPSLIIFDLNNAAAKPLPTIQKLKAKLKKETAIIGFLSHVQGELKVKAQEAGCDTVLPRSAFSSNLPQLLRRHGAPDEAEAN
jgi:DNA-binding NarL/FixJ family response regulator